MAATMTATWRFAPLREDIPRDLGAQILQGVIFDVDGTLCEPQTYMFGEMRDALGISKREDILEHIYGLPDQTQQHEAMELVRAIERKAMASQAAQPGLSQLMAYLDTRGIRKGIVTRNFDAPVNHLLSKFLPDTLFEPIITREFRPPKPDPAGILHIARAWGLLRTSGGSPGFPVQSANADKEVTVSGEEVADASGLIMVGDSIDDMTAGRKAGAATILLANDVNVHLVDHEHTDLVIQRLDDLVEILEHGLKPRQTVDTSE